MSTQDLFFDFTELLSPMLSPTHSCYDGQLFDPTLSNTNTYGIQHDRENFNEPLYHSQEEEEDLFSLLQDILNEPQLTVSCFHRIKKSGSWLASSVEFGTAKQQTKIGKRRLFHCKMKSFTDVATVNVTISSKNGEEQCFHLVQQGSNDRKYSLSLHGSSSFAFELVPKPYYKRFSEIEHQITISYYGINDILLGTSQFGGLFLAGHKYESGRKTKKKNTDVERNSFDLSIDYC